MTRKYIKNCTGPQCELEKRNSRTFSVIIFYFLLICFVGVLVYVLFFSQYLKILNISITGTQELDRQELEQSVDGLLAGNFLNVVPKNNFLFISQQRIENLLIGNFKKIRSVSVIKEFPDTIKINIDERKALLVWCSGQKCYLLDEQGIAYGEADFSSPEIVQNNLLQINDESGREINIGDKVINPAYEQYVLGLKDVLSEVGFNATGQYSTPSRMAEEINVKTQQETEFYFSTQFSQESALRTLGVIFKKEITQDQKDNVAYIDLRNENKVFYKFKNVEPAVADAQSTITVNADIKKEEKK